METGSSGKLKAIPRSDAEALHNATEGLISSIDAVFYIPIQSLLSFFAHLGSYNWDDISSYVLLSHFHWGFDQLSSMPVVSQCQCW